MKAPIPYDKLKEIILACPDKELQAILAYQYALACRLGELFPYTHKPYHFYPQDKRKPFKERRKTWLPHFETGGIISDSFFEYADHWEIVQPVFKQHEAKPIFGKGFLLKDNPQEAWLNDICLTWLQTHRANPQACIFSMNHETARKKIKKYLALAGFDVRAQKTFSSHNLRDSRADHLLKIYGFSVLDIQKTLHHKNLKTTSEYLDSSIDERIKKLKDATREVAK
jgi:integrase